jgi:hypothetical protein
MPKTTLADWLILLFALFMISALYQHYWRNADVHTDIHHAYVYSDNATLVLDLREAQTVSVDGSLGISLLQVDEGRVRFVSSPCPGKQCIRSGWQHHPGDFAACLPNRVSIQIGANTQFDSLVY